MHALIDKINELNPLQNQSEEQRHIDSNSDRLDCVGLPGVKGEVVLEITLLENPAKK